MMNDFYLSDCLQTKTGIYLMQEGNEEPFNIRLHLAKDILTIQEQDVICVSGEPFYSSVSSPRCFSSIRYIEKSLTCTAQWVKVAA